MSFTKIIIAVLLGSIVVGVIAGFLINTGSSSSHPSGKCVGTIGSTSYKIVNDWKGKDLKPEANKGWVYFTRPDPTLGAVKYGPYPELMTVHGDAVKIDLGNIPEGDNRREAIRINTSDTFDDGLFIIDASHMPAGLGTWPAFWLNGSKFPNGGAWACHGEIDILEGVNSDPSVPNSNINATTLHTNVPPNGKRCDQTGTPGIHGECGPDATPVPNSTCGCSGKEGCPYGGCGIKSTNTNSFGYAFNKIGGGVYACELTKEGKITVWFFERGQIPCDITANKPNPDKWDKKNITAEFKPCPGQFQKLQLIINTCLCGQWAGNAYPKKDSTGNSWSQCNTDVLAKKPPEGYWDINYVKIFQQ